MKALSIFLLGLVIANHSQARPYYRFWQGWKRNDISKREFVKAIDTVFIPVTVGVGSGKGLLSYLPALLPKNSVELPDEIALVTYKSKKSYDALKGTPERQAYGPLHWDYFAKEKGSRSTVPRIFSGSIELGNAYDVFESNADWQDGFAVAIISKVNPKKLSQYVSRMKQLNSLESGLGGFDRNILSYLVLADSRRVSDDRTIYYSIEYVLWKNGDSFDRFEKNWFQLRKKYSVDTFKKGLIELRAVHPQGNRITWADGVNIQFPYRETFQTVKSPMKFSRSGDWSDYDYVSNISCKGKVGKELANIYCNGIGVTRGRGGYKSRTPFSCDLSFVSTFAGKYYFMKAECD